MSIEENRESIEKFYKNNRYIDFLKSTSAYKDIFCSKEALVSLFLSMGASTLLVVLVLNNPDSETSTLLVDLLGIVIGAVFGLLGFVIGGLALIVGSIGRKMISVVNDSGKFSYLLSIIFRFYFVGSVLGASVVLHIFTYIILLFPNQFNFIFTGFLLLINSYLFFFSLIASIMLMGSCIRLMLLQYYFEDKMKSRD